MCWKDPKKWEATSCEGWVITHNTTEAYFIASCKRVTGDQYYKNSLGMVIMGVTVSQDFQAGNPPWWNFTMTSRLNCLAHGMSFRKVSFLQGCFCETRCMKITFGVSGVSLQSPDLDRSSFNISRKQADPPMMLRWQKPPKSYLLHLFKWWISKLLNRGFFKKVPILQRIFLLGCCIFRAFLHLKKGEPNSSTPQPSSCCNNSLFYDHFRYHFGLPTKFY